MKLGPWAKPGNPDTLEQPPLRSEMIGRAMTPRAVVARETELDSLRGFLAGGEGVAPAPGEPGIGKTMLWQTAVEEARHSGSACWCTAPSRPRRRSRSPASRTSSHPSWTRSPTCYRSRAGGRCASRCCWKPP